jgi:starch synthase
MHILFAASEAVPFIKTGGLADVVGELPLALVKQGLKVSVVIPKYSQIKPSLIKDAKFLKYFDVYMNNQKVYAGIYLLQQNKIDYYFIDNESLFKRDNVYGYNDDDARFGFFNLAVMEMISHLQLKIDIVHAHDWQCGPLSMLYYEKYHNYPFYENINWVFTIHNPAYQGLFDPKIVETIFGLNMDLYHNGTLRFKDAFSFIKVGIVYANKITTVSKTHANELLDPSFAYGLEGVINLRRNDLIGIVNGIDYEKYNPNNDRYIATNYRSSYSKKLINKEALQKRCGLEINPSIPLLAIISRLTWQKGIDLISPHVDELLNKNVQLVVLGSGDYQYENAFKYYAIKYPNKVFTYIGFNDELAHQIYAGADILLMPSLFEPCGISQLIALRYGTIPLVRQTGGLKDTVNAFNEYEVTGNGFGFIDFNYQTMSNIIDYALKFYYQKEIWDVIFKNALKSNFSWDQSAKEYVEVYKSIKG